MSHPVLRPFNAKNKRAFARLDSLDNALIFIQGGRQHVIWAADSEATTDGRAK